MRCPNNSAKAAERFLIHLVSVEQIRVIAEIPQKPIQLPEGSLSAIQPPRKQSRCKRLRLENDKSNGQERFLVNGDPECAVSWRRLHRMSIGIEFADEPVSILLGECRELSDKRFNQVTAGFFQGLCTAEIGGVSFHEVGIEVVLTDQQAKSVPQSRLVIARAVRSMLTARLRWSGQRFWRRRKMPELFDTAKPNPVGFAQSAIDGTGLSDP